MHSSTSPPTLLLFTSLATAQILGPVMTSSFTWNAKCGPTVACGPSAAGFHGTGFAAANNVTYAAGQPIKNGVGAGCGQCWHLMPEQNAYSAPGKSLGTNVVVKINDQCTDPKYCDQEEFGNNTPFNTGYHKQVHFDLCDQSGVTKQFFGEIEAGVALGLAQQVECHMLNYGTFGSKMGKIEEASGSGSSGIHISGGQLDSNSLPAGGEGTTSSSSAMGGAQSPSTSAAVAQPSTTLATVVGGSSPNPSPAADGEDEQDECDEL